MIKFYDNNCDYPNQNPFDPIVETEISVVDGDCFTVAGNEVGERVGVVACLNFASCYQPGGAYKVVQDIPMPINTQEEDLFRRSNLPQIMDTDEVRKLYPLTEEKAIYCKATVTKDVNLTPIEPFEVGVITMPAAIMTTSNDYTLPAKKIKKIFEIAYDNDVRVLILGAWGCGVFDNDPQKIAELFAAELNGDFKGGFCKVLFAVPESKSIRKTKYQVFNEVFS